MMPLKTPADKAKELVEQFRGKYHDVPEGSAAIFAMICCSEVLEAIAHWSASGEPYKFWGEVKDEIQKL